MIKIGEMYMEGKVNIGDKIYFRNEKKPYKVRASNAWLAVCTKPYNPKRTVIYTVIDFHEQIRGVENLMFGMGAETDEECIEMLDRLTNGESEISSRNRVKLKIEKYIPNSK